MNHYSSLAARIALVLCLLLSGLCVASRAADPCDLSVLPQELRTKLTKEYPDWQPERLENLDEEDRGLWIKAHPTDCPGIAVGHFESKAELSYALLLVSKPDRKLPGLRIVVFSRTGTSAPFVSRLISKYDTGTFYEGSAQVITTAPAGRYEQIDSSRKVRIGLEGIQYEVMEKGSILYYWRNGRYQQLTTSD